MKDSDMDTPVRWLLLGEVPALIFFSPDGADSQEDSPPLRHRTAALRRPVWPALRFIWNRGLCAGGWMQHDVREAARSSLLWAD